MRIFRFRDGLAVALPKRLVTVLGPKAGDHLRVDATAPRAIQVAKSGSIEERLVRLRRHRGRMPKDFRFDRDEANARG